MHETKDEGETIEMGREETDKHSSGREGEESCNAGATNERMQEPTIARDRDRCTRMRAVSIEHMAAVTSDCMHLLVLVYMCAAAV